LRLNVKPVGGLNNVQEELRLLFDELRGVHTYDRTARAWNWFVIWVFMVLPLVVGATELALYHSLGKLPEPETAHKFY